MAMLTARVQPATVKVSSKIAIPALVVTANGTGWETTRHAIGPRHFFAVAQIPT